MDANFFKRHIPYRLAHICRLWLVCMGLCLAWQTSSFAQEPRSAQEAELLRMGFYYPAIGQIASRSDILVALNFWIQELAENFQMAVSPVQLFDDMLTMTAAYREGSINLIVAPPMSIVMQLDRSELGDCFLGERANGKLDSVLLVSVRSPASTLESLKGKKLLIPEQDDLAEIFLNLQTLKLAKLPYSKFFGSIVKVDKTKRMLLDLFFGKADAAIVNQASFDLMTELNPQIREKLTILASFPAKSKNVSFIRPDFPLRRQLHDRYLKVADTQRGKQLLTLYQQETMNYCDFKDLEPYENLFKNYLQLSRKKP